MTSTPILGVWCDSNTFLHRPPQTRLRRAWRMRHTFSTLPHRIPTPVAAHHPDEDDRHQPCEQQLGAGVYADSLACQKVVRPPPLLTGPTPSSWVQSPMPPQASLWQAREAAYAANAPPLPLYPPSVAVGAATATPQARERVRSGAPLPPPPSGSAAAVVVATLPMRASAEVCTVRPRPSPDL